MVSTQLECIRLEKADADRLKRMSLQAQELQKMSKTIKSSNKCITAKARVFTKMVQDQKSLCSHFALEIHLSYIAIYRMCELVLQN